MSVLAGELRKEMVDPSSNVFFTEQENKILYLNDHRKVLEQNEMPCSKPAYIGVFFDGTNNSYRHAIENKTEEESNIARLYDVFPGRCVPGILPKETDWKTDLAVYERHFKIYVPGVGKAFSNIGDQIGNWAQTQWDGVSGGAMATYGQGRILWGIAQLLNYIYGYYHAGFGSSILITDEEVKYASENISLVQEELERKVSFKNDGKICSIKWEANSCLFSATASTKEVLQNSRLDNKKNATLVLCSWIARLKRSIGTRVHNPDILPLNKLHLYTFGFSRGATQARAYLNWLVKLCRLDAESYNRQESSLTLGGIPVSHDFMGIFDTVASVGWADMFVWSNGHDWWGDARSLQIPKEVGKCIHFVAAHEQRRCFPLDSVYQGQRLPEYCEEIVFPGVHSDVGGGYAPFDQGKGFSRSGTSTLSRIPLAEMYRRARLEGVPLELEKASEAAKLSYKIDIRLLSEFNTYISLFPLKEGTTAQIVTPHWEKLISQYFRRFKGGENSLQMSSATRAHYQDRELRDSIKNKRSDVYKEKHFPLGELSPVALVYEPEEITKINASSDAIYSNRLDAAEKITKASNEVINAEYKDFLLVKNNHYSELSTEDEVELSYQDKSWFKKTSDYASGLVNDANDNLRKHVFEDYFVLKNPEKKELKYVIDNIAMDAYLHPVIDSFIDNYIHDSVAGFMVASYINERFVSKTFVYFRYRRIFSGSNTFYQVPYDKGFDCSREDYEAEKLSEWKRKQQQEEENLMIGRQMADQMSIHGGMAW
ncbi:T6SS phospholipase effector Tle1-like catalytic domain-containing protein [Zymobacter sp. IVIA_12111.31 C1]|uniref:T6SS phospholipase effector Tle1-like catalytic domain-containing protein n=1 Tax=Zymobacter sp. IVIA_12111.31 C1 TaxID=3394854 RepID=UPI0039C47002